MNINDNEKAELEKLSAKHPVIKKLCEELESYEQDPTKIFLHAASKMTNAISEDMMMIVNGNEGDNQENLKILGSNKDDKLYDRVKGLLTDGEKILKGLDKAKAEVNQDVDLVKVKKLSKGSDLAI